MEVKNAKSKTWRGQICVFLTFHCHLHPVRPHLFHSYLSELLQVIGLHHWHLTLKLVRKFPAIGTLYLIVIHAYNFGSITYMYVEINLEKINPGLMNLNCP